MKKVVKKPLTKYQSKGEVNLKKEIKQYKITGVPSKELKNYYEQRIKEIKENSKKKHTGPKFTLANGGAKKSLRKYQGTVGGSAVISGPLNEAEQKMYDRTVKLQDQFPTPIDLQKVRNMLVTTGLSSKKPSRTVPGPQRPSGTGRTMPPKDRANYKFSKGGVKKTMVKSKKK